MGWAEEGGNSGHKICHKGGHPFALLADYHVDSCDETAVVS